MKKNKFLLILDRKAQVGITLTWITAFLVIFFIMLIFIVVSSGLFAKKIIPRYLVFGGSDKNIIKLDDEKSIGSLNNQRKLIRILNTPINKGETLSEKIIQWQLDKKNEEELKKEVKNILDNEIKNNECYMFYIVEEKILLISNSNNEISLIIDFDYTRFSNINLFSNKQKINMQFYEGECL